MTTHDDEYVPLHAIVAAFRWTGENLPAAEAFTDRWIRCGGERPVDVSVQTIDTTIGQQRYLDRTLRLQFPDVGGLIEIDEEQWLIVVGTDLPPGQRAFTVLDGAEFDRTYRSASRPGGRR